jgi:hypothetical protein
VLDDLIICLSVAKVEVLQVVRLAFGMAKYDQLPICRLALELTVFLEGVWLEPSVSRSPFPGQQQHEQHTG